MLFGVSGLIIIINALLLYFLHLLDDHPPTRLADKHGRKAPRAQAAEAAGQRQVHEPGHDEQVVQHATQSREGGARVQQLHARTHVVGGVVNW